MNMTTIASTPDQSRMQRVLDYIDDNLASDLTLDILSGVAAYSKFHFHRQFSARFGLSVHTYVRLARIKRAAWQLAYRDSTITDIAFDAGFGAPDAFSRAFRQCLAQSPSEFRNAPDWTRLHQALLPFGQARQHIQTGPFSHADVEVRDIGEIPISFMAHTGNPHETGHTLGRFIKWRRAAGLPPRQYPTYSIFHADPRDWPDADYREDFCVGVSNVDAAEDAGVEQACIPAGRHAVLNVRGDSDNLEAAIRFMYRDWVPGAGVKLRDFPIFCQRLSLFPDVAAHETSTDLFLPLK